MKNSLIKNFSFLAVFALVSALVFNACRKADVVLPDNLVNFETATAGIAPGEDSITIKLMLSRATDRNIQVVLHFTPTNAVYGTDFTIEPAPAGNAFTVIIPSGSMEGKFTIKKVPGKLYDGDEKLNMEIYSSETPVLIGAQKNLVVNFAELLSVQATATIDGGGTTFGNKVFLDLSANRQTPVNRNTWDLGLYGEGSDYRVILNTSSGMMAKATSKTNMADVTAADTAGLSSLLTVSLYAPEAAQMPYIDYPTGDMSRTAFAPVSANEAENKVYLVNRGFGIGNQLPARGWKKVRVLRNGSGGYTVQYADLNATSFQEVQIPKDQQYFFKYVSFDNGAVDIEPAKTRWDLAWTYFTNAANFGGGEVPYMYQDMILSNRNVSVAKILTSTKAFADFGEADLSNLNFSTSQIAIGGDWRSGGGPTSQPAVRTDRYYIVKDGDNNYYKVRFTALTQNGQRGYPAFEAVLIKEG